MSGKAPAKRSLLVTSTNQRKLAPLPASSQRLAALLDGPKKKRQKVVAGQKQQEPSKQLIANNEANNTDRIKKKNPINSEKNQKSFPAFLTTAPPTAARVNLLEATPRTLEHAQGWKPSSAPERQPYNRSRETRPIVSDKERVAALKRKQESSRAAYRNSDRLPEISKPASTSRTKDTDSAITIESAEFLRSTALSLSNPKQKRSNPLSTFISLKSLGSTKERNRAFSVPSAPQLTSANTANEKYRSRTPEVFSSIGFPPSLPPPRVEKTKTAPKTSEVPPSDTMQQSAPTRTLVSMQSVVHAPNKSTASYRPNLVRQNLRNSNGACRNRRAPSRSLSKTPYTNQESSTATPIDRPLGLDQQTGTDPIDDFCDGLGGSVKTGRQSSNKTASGLPLCQGHQQPCCLRTVRKTGMNKGRKFYACALPRHEQCNHFAWVDNNDGSAMRGSREDSTTGFVQRQVQAYLGHLQALTVPELRQWAAARRLDTKGKRGALWTRISLYVRDEIVHGIKNDDSSNPEGSAGRVDELKEEEEEEEELTIVDLPKAQGFTIPLEYAVDSNTGDAEKRPTLLPEQDGVNDKIDDSSTGDSESEDDSEEDELEILPKKLIRNDKSRGDTGCPLRNRLQSLFGHDDFRPGQEWTIRRCLQGRRSLLVAPTGMGKSLCYALPAAMEPDGVVLVVSPLLSLIQDQLRELPPSLPAASLSGSMPSPTLLQDLRRGRIRILFVSPERLVSPSFRRLLSKTTWNALHQTYERILPRVSLFCVDEAHCLSQWGHNFRPCYLRLQSILNLIQPKSVLAITATAGPRVINDITRTLGMPNFEMQGNNEAKGIKIFKADRDNIDVSVHFLADHGTRLNKLVEILSPDKNGETSDQGDGTAGCLSSGSVIVYVWRQMDAEVIAEYISTAGIRGKVVVYHGGMDSASRAKAQSQFLRGKARICVATVAFGLGINKSDVAGVVHMYLSNTPEHYLQEIGRAGRDGTAARAIALIVPDELQVRHSLTHTDLLAKSQVRVLFSILRDEIQESLLKLTDEQQIQSEGLCVGLSLQSILYASECKPETTETIFSLLEAKEEPLLRVQGSFYGRAVIAPRKKSLEDLSRIEHVIDAIRRCCQCVDPPAGQRREEHEMVAGFKGHNLVGQTYGSFVFSIAQCANCLGPDAEPRHVFAALRRLQQSGEIEYVLDTTHSGRFIHMRLHRKIVENLRHEDASFEALVDDTYVAFNLAVSTLADKVLEIYRILRLVNQIKAGEMHNKDKSASLHLFQKLIQEYLVRENNGAETNLRDELNDAFVSPPPRKSLELTVWSVVQHLKQLQNARASADVEPMTLDHLIAPDYTVLAASKFLHGIAPSSSPASLCRQHNSFGSMQSVEFSALQEVVASIIT